MRFFPHLTIYHLKQAYLSLKQKPAFVFSVVSTMGITLGTLLCVLTLSYVMLIKPLPYPDQDRLFNVEHQLLNQGSIDGVAFTYPNLMHLYNNQSLFEQSTLVYLDGAVITSLKTEPMAEISFVTPEWFQMFDTKMALGRTFEASEKVNTFNPVALLSFDMWQNEFSGSDDILNKSVTFSGKSYRIIGVLSKENIDIPLSGGGFTTKIFIPWDFNTVSERNRKAWGNDDGGLMFLGKLKENFLLNQSDFQRDQSLTQLVNENWQSQVSSVEFFKGWGINIKTTPLKSYIVSNSKKSLLFLIIGALGLVIIASVNIANLFMSHTAERQQQLAICAAVGASKRQLFAGILHETTLLMFFALLIAQVIAYVGFSALHYSLGEYLPRINELSLNNFSIMASIAILILITLFFSYLCQRAVNYKALNTTLQSSGKGNGVQVSKRIRNVLIVSQIAVATTLIFINIALNKDATKLINQPLGYETRNINSIVLSLPNVERSLNAEHLKALKQALLSSPKIAAVSQSMRPSIFGTFALTTEKDNQRFSVSGKDVDEHYFSMINQPIIEGENFSSYQINDKEKVTIINEVLARKIAPNSSAIGLKFTNGARIIGVVKGIRVPGRSEILPRFYFPASPSRNMLLVKLVDGQRLAKEELISLLKITHKSFSVFSYSSLDNYKNEKLFSQTITAYTTVVITLFTFFLSALGLYGILKYSSQMRKFEIGTRLAIGAKGKDIVLMILKDNAGAIVWGLGLSAMVLIGLFIKFGQYLNHYAFNEIALFYFSSVGLIIALSIFACYLPLKKYISQPVMQSLRGNE